MAILHPAFANTSSLHGKISLEGEVEGELENTVVYVVGFKQAPEGSSPLVIQREEMFKPRIVPLTVGQTVEFANQDLVIHNVFSISSAREFDLGDQNPGSRNKVKFSNLGLVNIFCNIHPDMAMMILVLPNRAHARASADGSFEIKDIPQGEYKVIAWHPLAKPITTTIKFSDVPRTHNFVLKLDKKVRPHLNKYGRPYKKSKY